MPDADIADLMVTVARIEERLVATQARLGRVELILGTVAAAILGAIVTTAATIL